MTARCTNRMFIRASKTMGVHSTSPGQDFIRHSFSDWPRVSNTFVATQRGRGIESLRSRRPDDQHAGDQSRARTTPSASAVVPVRTLRRDGCESAAGSCVCDGVDLAAIGDCDAGTDGALTITFATSERATGVSAHRVMCGRR